MALDSRLRLIAFDLDDTLCPTGRTLPVEHIVTMDLTSPEIIRAAAPHITYAPYPAALDLVKRLHGTGTELAVVTNGKSYRQRNKLALSGLDAYFKPDRIFVSEECAWERYLSEVGSFTGPLEQWQECLTRIEKPAPYMLVKLTEKTGIPARESLFIGDSDADRLAAWSAGWQFYHVKCEEDLRKLDERLRRP
jgi:FMN phosphatase YigB (HAD superfamily)